MEHIRRASSLKRIAAGSWEAAIDDVLHAARRDAGAEVEAEKEAEALGDDEAPAVPQHREGLQAQPFTPVLTPAELIAAARAEHSAPLIGSRRPSSVLRDVASDAGASSAFAGPEQASGSGPEQAVSAGPVQALSVTP